MNTSPTKHAERIVLAALLGNASVIEISRPYDMHPYASDFPRNLLVTFEQEECGRVHRIFFALYGGEGGFTAELRGLPPHWSSGDGKGKLPRLFIERWYDGRKEYRESDVVAAFMKVARAVFTGKEAEVPEPEAWEGDDV